MAEIDAFGPARNRVVARMGEDFRLLAGYARSATPEQKLLLLGEVEFGLQTLRTALLGDVTLEPVDAELVMPNPSPGITPTDG